MALRPRTFERYGAAFLAADRLSRPDRYPAVGTATAATVETVDGPLQPTADPADGLRPQRLWAAVSVKPGTAKAQALAEAAEARRTLRRMLKPGAEVLTNLRHVSRSGMLRHISVHVAKRGRVEDITRLVALATGDDLTPDRDALRVGGAGMDMGFHVVYGLSSRLYPDGYQCAGQKCRANDHSNGDRDRSGKSHHMDGGYALRHRWL